MRGDAEAARMGSPVSVNEDEIGKAGELFQGLQNGRNFSKAE